MLNEFNASEIALRTAVIAMLGVNPVSQDQIREAVINFQKLFPREAVDIEKIVRNVEVCLNVLVSGVSGVLGDDIDHKEWLGVERTNISWSYWERYKYYLLNVKHLPLAVVENLEETTDAVLGRLEKPSREGQWDRRGMVVGHVQSGKTGHYTGLICKAVDSGYKLIVVLAGADNGLRAQTQLRIDEGFLGRTMGYRVGDQQGRNVGVGLLPPIFGENLNPATFTTAADDGDFKINVARGLGILPGAIPIVLVVKKNTTVLNNLYNWSKANLGSDRNGIHKIPDVPVLVIDDECDHASVNTKNTFYDFQRNQDLVEPTRINGHIRKYLNMFDRSAYVGYTATPFANIFIYHHPGKEDEKYSEDLFPRSFIICLPRSSDYMGADQVFGLQKSILQGIDEKDPLPIVREFDDLDSWISPTHKIDWKPPSGKVPKSLVDAITSFVLVCAARMSRGQTREHNSMLVHLTRFVDVQGEIKIILQRELRNIKNAICNSAAPEGRPIYAELKKLWESDFLKTTSEFNDPDLSPLSWHEIEANLRAAVEKIEVKVINGTSEDALQYFNNQELGVSVIAVGGAKLSRGLTLEGLSVSYFQRTTKMYDTLMQMGRWFGYRPGYRDLCRLFTTKELIGWYEDITMATEELYNQFDQMVLQNRTPKEFGLKVAQSPQNLLITAKVKMRNALPAKLSWEGQDPSFRFFKAQNIAGSIKATESLIRWATSNYISHPTEGKPSHLYKGCSPAGVIRFLTDFPRYPGGLGADPELLRNYIDLCVKQDELTSWSIAFISLADDSKRKTVSIEGLDIILQQRTFKNRSGDLEARSLWSGGDQSFGLSTDELHKATSLAAAAGRPCENIFYRHGRSKSHGLLVIYFLENRPPAKKNAEPNDLGEFSGFPYLPGFAVSFPSSESAPALDYRVRNDYFGERDADDDDGEDQ